MALDPREFRNKRQTRQAQRRQQQARRKSLLIKLAIAAVVVIVCTVLIITVSRRSKAEPTPTVASIPSATEGSGTAESTAPSQSAAESGDTVIHLAAAGDLNVTQGVVDSAQGEYDYTNTFMDVAPVLASADITTVNFEGNFFGAPYGQDYSAPETMAQALSDAGVDLVQLANSYSIYKGMDGLASTVQTIHSANMRPVGAYATPDEAKAARGFTLCTVQGVRIAFVSFTKGMNGMALPAGNEGCVNLLYKDYSSDYQEVDTEGITAVLDAVWKEKPDLTVALLHWGSEYNNTVSESQKEITQLLQGLGVDAIIGTHSHYVQKMEFDPDKGTFVAYSLGDFLGDAPRAGSEYSVILDLEITKFQKTGETKITGYSYTPIFSVVEEGKPIRVVRIQQAMLAYDGGYIDSVSQSTYDAMKNALERIKARVKGE